MLTKLLSPLAIAMMARYEPDASDAAKDKYRYGIELFLSSLEKSLVCIVIALLTGNLWYMMVMMFIMHFFRKYARGLHSLSGAACLIWSALCYIGGCMVARAVQITAMHLIVFYGVAFVVFFIYAPKSTYDTPILQKHRQPLKKKALLVLSLFFIISYFFGESVYRNLIVIAAMEQCINLLPITYKCFGVKERYL